MARQTKTCSHPPPRVGLWGHRRSPLSLIRAHHHHPRAAGRARHFLPRAARRGNTSLIARFFICYGLDDSHTIDFSHMSRQGTLKYARSTSLPSMDLDFSVSIFGQKITSPLEIWVMWLIVWPVLNRFFLSNLWMASLDDMQTLIRWLPDFRPDAILQNCIRNTEIMQVVFLAILPCWCSRYMVRNWKCSFFYFSSHALHYCLTGEEWRDARI
jgi:hypothetical protein